MASRNITAPPSALVLKATVLFVPASMVLKADSNRFGLLREITQCHGAYTSAKAKRDIPQFECEIGFTEGAKETFSDLRRRGKWRDGANDATYNAIVEQAIRAGVEPVEL